jgi:hypothetical protein
MPSACCIIELYYIGVFLFKKKGVELRTSHKVLVPEYNEDCLLYVLLSFCYWPEKHIRWVGEHG